MFKKLGFINLLLIAVILPSIHSAKDATLEQWTTGKEVTEAVLRKISRSEIFPDDNSFLIRLAFVESRFGENNNAFRDDYFGGIWQVEESVFRITQTNHSTISSIHTAIQSKFGITWSRVTWKDLARPFYSGLAVALYFARVVDECDIPQTVSGQATHWIKYYRPLGDHSKFQKDAEELYKQTRCRGKMDLCIVLDSSGSIGPTNYQLAKDFVAFMIESFTLDYSRIGMVIYSNDPQIIFEIHNSNSIAEMAELAQDADYIEEGTRTDKGIKTAVQMFNRSAAFEDIGAPKIMTVFTDGNSDYGSDLNGAIRQVQDSSIKSISIGIGSSIGRSELLLIALGDSRNVFSLDDFSGLHDFLQVITSVTCDVPQKPALHGIYNDALLQNEKRIYEIEPPAEGITIIVTISVGKTNEFWSYTEEVPTAAVNDGTIDGPTFIPCPKKSRQANNNYTLAVYFTIQGVEATNNYTLIVANGNQRGNGASVTSLAISLVFVLMFLHVIN